jgi:hypothetical protein
MRSQLGQWPLCTLNDGVSSNALAAVYYEYADINSVPQSTSSVTAAQLASCKNENLGTAIPLCKIDLPQPEVKERIDFDFRSTGTSFIWFWDNEIYRDNYNSPVLLDVKEGRSTFEPGGMSTSSQVRSMSAYTLSITGLLEGRE